MGIRKNKLQQGIKNSKFRVQHPSPHSREGKVISRIRGSLSLDLRHPAYPVEEDEYYWACLNHCYVATEAAYHLFGRIAGYVPYVYKHKTGGTHWWLVNKETGAILDPTEPQLDGQRFPYEKGRRAVFLTKKPSKRARELIRRVGMAGR